jgi:hypothetical protein
MKMKRFLVKIFCLGLCCVCYLGCTDKEKIRETMIQNEISARLKAFETKRYNECLVAALDSANRIADSLILARMVAGDSSALFGKPVKPIKPIIKSPLDTTPVVPIVGKDSVVKLMDK